MKLHAGDLFALAEATGEMFLLREFGEVENAVSVVRNAEVKYKKPASGVVFSKAKLSVDKNVLLETLQTKKRALVPDPYKRSEPHWAKKIFEK